MTAGLSTSRTGPLEKVFHYYTDFEQYPQRYSKFCVRVDIISKGENSIVTKEFWNVTLIQKDHVTIKVRYTLVPNNEIEFEIIDDDGVGTGTKGKIILKENKNGKIGATLDFPILEILAQSYGDENSIAKTVARYLNEQDVEIYEGRKTRTRPGDLCPFCNDGRIWPTGKTGKTDSEKEFHAEIEFECDKCKLTVGFAEVGIKENIGIGENTVAKLSSDEDTNDK